MMSINELPKRVQQMGKLAINCKTIHGRAFHLQRFIYSLLAEKRYGYGIFHAYQKLLEHKQEEIRIKKEAYSWLQNEVEQLSGSQAAGIPFVAATIRHFWQLLSGKRPLISSSFFGLALEAFKKVAFAIQPFGELKILDGRAEYIERKECLVFKVREFPINVDKRVEISPWSKEGKILVNRLGQGFQSAILSKIKLIGEEKEEIHCEIKYIGSLILHWPRFIHLLLEKENVEVYQEVLETDIGMVLGHINFITQVCNQKLLGNEKRWQWPKSTNPLILDRAVEDWHSIQYCLSLGRNSDPAEILSQNSVKGIVELFSQLVSSVTYHADELSYPKWKSWLSKFVENYAETTLTTWLSQLDLKRRRLIRNEDAYHWLVQYMKKQELPDELIKLTTETLIKETVAPKVKKCIDWRPMRDGPKRQEELKKLGSIYRFNIN